LSGEVWMVLRRCSADGPPCCRAEIPDPDREPPNPLCPAVFRGDAAPRGDLGAVEEAPMVLRRFVREPAEGSSRSSPKLSSLRGRLLEPPAWCLGDDATPFRPCWKGDWDAPRGDVVGRENELDRTWPKPGPREAPRGDEVPPRAGLGPRRASEGPRCTEPAPPRPAEDMTLRAAEPLILLPLLGVVGFIPLFEGRRSWA